MVFLFVECYFSFLLIWENSLCNVIDISTSGFYGIFLQILDAPALQDDFYLNLVDWSSLNVLAVGLGNCVYLWNASNSKVRFHLFDSRLFPRYKLMFLILQIVKLCDLGNDESVCSVCWTHGGNKLAIGTSSGKLQVRYESSL